MGVKRLRIHDKEEAIRLVKAGLLYWIQEETDTSRKYDIPQGDARGHALNMWWNLEYEYYKPHILVEEEEEEDNCGQVSATRSTLD